MSALTLLVALLMPALAGARSGARELACRANVRQLVLANLGYAQENDGFYVPAASDLWNNAGLRRWHGMRDNLNQPFDPRKGPLMGYLIDGKVKDCPIRVNFVQGLDWDQTFEQGCGGYGYNMLYLGSRLWDTALSAAEGYRLAYTRTTSTEEVQRPGQTLMFADTAMANHDSALIEYSFAEPPFTVISGRIMTGVYMSPSIHFRHRQAANIGWADGHVGAERMAAFDETNAYGVHSAGLNLGWFAPVDNTFFDLE
jgi:prepilin-type processing-associated H-X9-DG protein